MYIFYLPKIKHLFLLTQEDIIMILFSEQNNMQNDCGSDTINFDTCSLLSSPMTSGKSFFSDNQALSEEYNRVVKNDICHKSVGTNTEIGEDIEKPKRIKNVWSAEEELEYFYGAIKFALDNPHFTVSWQCWKPLRFYNYLEHHMQYEFGKTQGRNGRQCKTKDQNLKVIYFEKSPHPLDLIDLSLKRLMSHINDNMRKIDFGVILTLRQLGRIDRFKEILSEYRCFLQDMKKPKDYELQFRNLMKYSQQIDSKMQEVYASSF